MSSFLDAIKTMLPPWAIVLIFFLFITRDAWKKVISEGALTIKNKWFNFDHKGDEQGRVESKDSRESKKLKKLCKDLGVKNITAVYSAIEDHKRTVEEVRAQSLTNFQWWQFYMFSYFNLYLVPRTKLILVWLYSNPNSTKELLCLNIPITSDVENRKMEEEAVFNALISHNLIEKDLRDLYQVSNIGKDYLQYSGLIKLL